VSPVFAPSRFFVGATFGIVAGFFEEIGWMGFAFPKMTKTGNLLGASFGLGVLWGCWHIPVIDFLGTATPHSSFWLPYFLAFTAAMTAMRVLIGWIYANTKSVALAQLMHTSSTGSLVVLSLMMKAQPKGGKYGPYKTSRISLRRTHHGCGGGASGRGKRDCGVHCRRTCRRTR